MVTFLYSLLFILCQSTLLLHCSNCPFNGGMSPPFPAPPPSPQYGGFYRKLVKEQIVPRHLCKYKFQSPVRTMTFSSFPYSGHSRLSTRLPLKARTREITVDSPEQRILNDLKIIGLSRLIWLLPHPSPLPSPVSKSLFHKLSSCVLPVRRAYWRVRGRGVGAKSCSTTARKPGPLKIIQYSLVLK
jgi:hypothetical protein